MNERKAIEILNFILQSDKVELSYVQEEMEMNKRKEMLQKYEKSIFFGSDGYWHTNLPKHGGGRKSVKKRTRESLEQAIIEYLEQEESSIFSKRYEIWVSRQEACGRNVNTIHKYRSDYKRFFEGDEIVDMDIKYIDDEEISKYILRTLIRKKVQIRALKMLFGYINGVFEKAIKDKIIKENPCKYVDLEMLKKYCYVAPRKTVEQRTLSQQEADVLLRKLRNAKSECRFAAEFTLHVGMRSGELSALKWDDIDFKQGIIIIRNSEKFNRETKEYYIDSTKNQKERIIPLTKETKEVLFRTRQHEIEMGYYGEFVFMGPNGRIHGRAISECVRNNSMTSEFAGRKSVHAIRRTLNSNMRTAGVPATVASSLLGHSERVNEMNYTYDMTTMDQKRDILRSASVAH